MLSRRLFEKVRLDSEPWVAIHYPPDRVTLMMPAESFNEAKNYGEGTAVAKGPKDLVVGEGTRFLQELGWAYLAARASN